ncbi:MAG: hypothetical protein EXR52_02515 [Dehalococcoidia bacterium]|nr:hypothetical protein [Dehalococcoidia bacterium]
MKTPNTYGSTILATNPASTFANSGAEGISRLVAVGEHLFINNIARNYELVTPVVGPDGGLTLRRDAYHDVTSFPGQDIPSQLDLDAHGVFLRPDLGTLLVHDHHGRIRTFRYPPPSGPLQQTAEWRLLGDSERVVMAGDRLITSSPRGQYSSDPPALGIFMAEPLPFAAAAAGDGPQQLGYQQVLADWDVVTALAVSADGGLLAVGTTGRLGVFALEADHGDVALGRCIWQHDVPFHTQWLYLQREGSLLAGGYALGAADADGAAWDACRGGAVSAFAVGGRLVGSVPAPEDTAWGYAGNPLVASATGDTVYAIDRGSGLHALDIRSGTFSVVAPPLPGGSLGIGHATVLGGRAYAAYTRGGFRLLAFNLD